MAGGDSGATSSGTALRLRLVSPRIKAQRIATLNTATVKSMILALCKNNGLKLEPKNLALIWNDGLPDDEVEDAKRWQAETGGKQVKAVKTAIKERGLNDEQAEKEYELIREEQASAMPAVLTRMPTVDGNAADGGDDE